MDRALVLELIGYIIRIILIIVGSAVTAYIKKKIDATKLAQITNWVEIAVKAAEQIYKETGMGERKKEYVIEFLMSKGFKISEEELDKIIESIVYGLNTRKLSKG